MSEERQNRPPITQKDLKDLVEKALQLDEHGKYGVLDISNCTIDFEFNLVEILKIYGLLDLQCVKDPTFPNFSILNMKCPFEIKAVNTHFFEGFSTFYQDGLSPKFIDITFTKKVDFASAIFEKGAQFLRSTFQKEAIFFNTIFKGYAAFDSTTFKKGAMFATTTFHNAFLLSPKELQGKIEIQTPNLESDKRSFVVDLGSCNHTSKSTITFQGLETDHDRICLKIRNLKKVSGVKIHFKKCGFYGKNVAFTNVAMRCVAIQGGNYVSGMSFYHCDWASIHSFLGLKFRAFQGIKSSDRSKIADSYGNLKVSALDAGDAQLSNDFHFWHQWHQWENLYQKRLWNWNNFYRITSAYGMSVRLPLFWFICVIGIFIFFYAPITKVPQPTLMFAFRTSIENSLPLIGWTRSSLFNTHPTQYLLLSILQHLIQGYLLFQIGAAIRNKVKR